MANAVLFRRLVSSLRRRGAKKVSLFGSYARGEQRKGSDIDVVVDFSKPKSLLELVRIEGDVSAELGVKVDLLTSGSVSSHLSNAVKRDVKVLLG
jgi:predicted nucleotidyltransferase